MRTTHCFPQNQNLSCQKFKIAASTYSIYDVMPKLELEIVYPFNRQYSMSAAKVCWVNSVACNLLYHIISTIEIYFVIELSGGPIRAGGCKR